LAAIPADQRYTGRIAKFFLTRAWWGTKEIRLVSTRASGQSEFGAYL
jgi:hypothetical protein